MGIDIRLPHITGSTEREQLDQLKRYLFQLREQLQVAFDTISVSAGSGNMSSPTPISPSVAPTSASPELTFSSLKALIIKSADIVDAFYDEINTRLEGVYVAQSDFGDYAQRTSQEIQETSQSTIQRFENIQVIVSNHDKDIASISGDLQTIGQDLSYTQKDIIAINSSVETIDSHVTNVEVEVNELGTSLQTAKTEFQSAVVNTKNELSSTINSTKAELASSIEGTSSKLSGDINTAKNELVGNVNNVKADLEGEIQAIEEEIGYTQNDLNAIGGSVEELSGNIAKAEGDIMQLDENLQNAKSELSGSIDNAKSELSDDIDNAKNELTGMVDEVDSDLQNTKTDVNGRIDDTNGSVAGLGESLNDANSRIAEVDEDLQDTKEVINESIQGVQDRVTGVNALLEDAKAQLNGSLEDLEVLITGLQSVIIGVTAYLKSGLLYYTDAGIPVYGLEIGQSVRDEIAGTEVFNKFTRFTSEKLSFYDSNGNEVAYISDKKLYIRMAHITVSFQIGGLISLVMANGDVVKKWIGG